MLKLDDITIANFKKMFGEIINKKKSSGIVPIHDNPTDLLERAKLYGTHFKNDSWGWASNIWSRSAPGSVIVNKEEELKPEHKQLMLRVLEHILSQGPLIQVDANIGQPGSKAEMKCRFYCDPQFPDLAYRWSQINFPGKPDSVPDVTIFHIPHYLENPNVPGTNEMLKVIRFPNQNYSIITCSSYQGEIKKGFLTHWIYHVYKKGGCGEHASLKEFTVKRIDNKHKRIVMSVWGLTGSGKSTHGFYVITEKIAEKFKQKFNINPLDFISDHAVKNDDIVGVFEDMVCGSERGSWTKTEGVDERQIAILNAASSPRGLHENTEFGSDGNPSFEGKLYQYWGKLNQNARSVFYLEDTGYFDGNVNSSEPLNFAVFVSPGYTSDYAWVKINDSAFACKVLADGRTIGHPAQTRKGVGEEKYVARYCLPFTMGVSGASHVHRFCEFVKKREKTDNPIEVYLINTTGKVGTKYNWTEIELGGEKVNVPKTVFEEVGGKTKPVGGTGPSIEETELFLFQAARGTVEYEPHPIWGNKVLVPVKVPGISKERLQQLNPFNYRSLDEMKKLLQAQITVSKFNLSKQCPGLDPVILKAMDF